MTISVALCTYNGAAFLEAQLASLESQSRLPDEVVICDDGSDDGTLSLLRDFASRAPFAVHVEVNTHRLGSTQNFARAIGLCRSDIISLCDQDDVWLPLKLQRTEEAFDARPDLGLAFCDAELVDEALHPLGGRFSQRAGLGASSRARIEAGGAFAMLLRENFVSGNALAFRAAFRPLVLPIPEGLTLLHDGWAAALIAAVAPIAFIDEPLLLWRQHPAQQNGAGVPLSPGGSRYRSSALMASILATPHAQGQMLKAQALRQRLLSQPEGLSGPSRAALRKALLKAAGESRRARAEHAHLQARAALLQKPRAKRLAPIAREAWSRGYRRHSNGLLSVLKDIAQPPGRKLQEPEP